METSKNVENVNWSSFQEQSPKPAIFPMVSSSPFQLACGTRGRSSRSPILGVPDGGDANSGGSSLGVDRFSGAVVATKHSTHQTQSAIVFNAPVATL